MHSRGVNVRHAGRVLQLLRERLDARERQLRDAEFHDCQVRSFARSFSCFLMFQTGVLIVLSAVVAGGDARAMREERFAIGVARTDAQHQSAARATVQSVRIFFNVWMIDVTQCDRTARRTDW